MKRGTVTVDSQDISYTVRNATGYYIGIDDTLFVMRDQEVVMSFDGEEWDGVSSG